MTPLDITITAFSQLIKERDEIIQRLYVEKGALLDENVKLIGELVEEKQKRLKMLSNSKSGCIICKRP